MHVKWCIHLLGSVARRAVRLALEPRWWQAGVGRRLHGGARCGRDLSLAAMQKAEVADGAYAGGRLGT